MENSLAENIRRYRKRLGLTQEQLAERLGITLGAVSKWERGSSEPDLSYIMDLAELFHVSVDALIGFTMRGTDANEEADRIEELWKKASITDTDEGVSFREVAGEYENALKKFPNVFRIVFSAAKLYEQTGVLFKQDADVKRALELFRHALDLISQNKDPEINEVVLRDEIAVCYSALKDYKRAIGEYKSNNLTGSNDARIGLLYTLFEKKPEDGIAYTEKAFCRHISDFITTMAGYMSYYIITGKYEPGIRAAEWMIRFLESLKEDPGRHAYTDKIASLFYLDMALLRDLGGMPEASEESLRTAVRTAAAFDADPVFTLENLILLGSAASLGVYDDTGPSATDGLVTSLEDISSLVSDAFREKLDREIEAARQPG